jgi:Mrp family chromosome partitioning ATPase
VVFVDVNFDRPAAATIFGIPDSPGLVQCVCDGEPVLETSHATTMENLFVLASGKIGVSPARVYDSPVISDLVSELADHSTLTVFDLPPLHQASCVNRLAPLLDGIVLVVEAEFAARETILRARELLDYAGARIVGAVLNKWRKMA